MAINAVVAELEDATTMVGNWIMVGSSLTSTEPYKTGYQRGTMAQSTAGAGSHFTKALPSAKTTQCITGGFGSSGASTYWNANSDVFFGVQSSGTTILGVATTTTTGLLKLLRWNGATWDTLATGARPVNSAIRLDMFIEDFGASGRVRVWLSYFNGTAPAVLWLDTGAGVDLATGTGATDFDGIYACGTDPVTSGNVAANRISQIIAADEPTLRLPLVTCYPNAAGDVNQWTGAYTAVDEMNADIGDFTETGSAGQLFLANITDLPSGNTLTPLGVGVTILAAKGATGPTSIKIAIKTHGTVYYGTTYALTLAYAGYSYLWTVNPSTGIAWTQAEITALQIGYESVA